MRTILPETIGRFGLIQIIDDYGHADDGSILGPLSASQIKTEAPHYDGVWASFDPHAWSAVHHGMILSRYMIPNEDNALISRRDLAWWQKHRPSWVLYACDAGGNPTRESPWSGVGFSDVPLDIHNPAVVRYQVHLLGNYMIAHGYNALAVDNFTFVNYMPAPNPVLGQGHPQPGWYACGIYADGKFIRRYGSANGSDFGRADPAWIADLLNWIETARKIFDGDPKLASHHLKILVNHPILGETPNDDERQMLRSVDGVVVENGFTSYGHYIEPRSRLLPRLFTQSLSWMRAAQAIGIAVFVTDYFCEGGVTASGASCSYNPLTLSASQVDWALATYAIANDGGADVYIAPEGGDNYSYRPEYSRVYGAPCGNVEQTGAVYTRRFQRGMAIVNASYTAQAISLPPHHTYTDIEGRTLTDPLTVNGADAYMLLTSAGGCS
ncbi:MAG TPA: hypothetical protein VMD07_07065 [Candidatus Acidoferrales bacterium]|nr:hypothetical protein [Candidatus Acidoferrales bacterium]